MSYRVFNTNTYLVPITKKSNFGNGFIEETWYWEITIADRGTDYFGMAIERSKGITINWCDITDIHPIDKMTKLCEAKM